MGFNTADFERRLAARKEREQAKATVQIDTGEQIAGTFPSELRRQLEVIDLWLPVGTKKTAGADSLTTVDVHAEAITLGVAVVGSLVSLSVVGAQTGLIYLPSLGGSGITGWMTIPINGSIDSRYKVTWAGGSSGTISVFSSAIPVPYPSIGQTVAALSVPVVLANDPGGGGAPYWLTPNKPPAFASQAGAGNSVLVAAVAGQLIRVFGWEITTTVLAAGAVVLIQDSSGNNLAEMRANAVGQIAGTHAGAPLTNVGDGLRITVAGGAASGDAYVSYSQA